MSVCDMYIYARIQCLYVYNVCMLVVMSIYVCYANGMLVCDVYTSFIYTYFVYICVACVCGTYICILYSVCGVYVLYICFELRECATCMLMLCAYIVCVVIIYAMRVCVTDAIHVHVSCAYT